MDGKQTTKNGYFLNVEDKQGTRLDKPKNDD